MNEQTSKKILFNKSTLFSLKAELLRKQEEVHIKKQLPQHKPENFKPAVKPQDTEQASNTSHKKTLKDSLKAVDTEELEACRKAKLALEKKAELYEHLSDGAGNSQLAGRFLVDFNTKKQQEPRLESKEKPISKPVEQDKDEHHNIEDEWTEFTDCLGRTRKCHKSDLDMYLERDRALMRVMNKDKPQCEDDELIDQESNKQTEKPLLVQKTQDYLQSLRDKWEQKERELLAKDKDIHYQDLLFDEARIHGVGYYSFSTDETERRRQMQELTRSREETLKAQREAELVRSKRDALQAARVAAARARQRARAGLPPEEPQENQDDFTKRLLEFLTKQKDEADEKANEEEKRLKEEQERERQKLRDAYVREWDIGKEGVDGNVKGFREMTQEEYVDQQRSKRIEEFAPIQSSTSKESKYTFDTSGKAVGPAQNKSWDDVRPRVPSPSPPETGDVPELSEQKGLYFTSATKSDKVVKYRNFVKAQDPVPIENELVESDYHPEPEKRKHDSNHAEVAPPPIYDYYGPVPKHMKTQKPFESDIREAYAQGAKSLESKSNYKRISSHYDFTFD